MHCIGASPLARHQPVLSVLAAPAAAVALLYALLQLVAAQHAPAVTECVQRDVIVMLVYRLLRRKPYTACELCRAYRVKVRGVFYTEAAHKIMTAAV
eukprot:16289-Heterococcus_DN1.PRE.4